jgi:hypothetical protein
MLTRRRMALGVALLLLGLADGGHEHAPVRLRVRPQACLAPCRVLIEVDVPRHAAHRGLSLTWAVDGAEAGSSWRLIEGDQDRRIWSWPPMELRERGTYAFVVSVWLADGRVCATVDRLVWVGPTDPNLAADRRDRGPTAGRRGP